MLGRVNGGGEFKGTPVCIGPGAVAATKISLSGADGVICPANAIPQVQASTSATNDALAPNANLLTRNLVPRCLYALNSG